MSSEAEAFASAWMRLSPDAQRTLSGEPLNRSIVPYFDDAGGCPNPTEAAVAVGLMCLPHCSIHDAIRITAECAIRFSE